MDTKILVDLGFAALGILIEQLLKLGQPAEDIKVRVSGFIAKVDATEAADKAGDIAAMGLPSSPK